MIGQDMLLRISNKLIEKDSFPHILILEGQEGSGRRTISNEIGKMLDSVVIEAGVSVSDVRSMIENCHKMVNRTLHIIPEADTMSVAAQNAMLKVIEEPPNDCYFILTVQNKNALLDTILSRSTHYKMEAYTEQELREYIDTINVDDGTADTMLMLSDTIGQIKQLAEIDVQAFMNYVELVIDNIAEVTGANSFKIAEKIALKKDSDGYDLKMFFKAFMILCLHRMEENKDSLDIVKYSRGLTITSHYLVECGIRGVSKPMLMDNWILDIRKEWMK